MKDGIIATILSIIIIAAVICFGSYLENLSCVKYLGTVVDMQVTEKTNSAEDEFVILIELETGDVKKFKFKSNRSREFWDIKEGDKYVIYAKLEDNGWYIHNYKRLENN